jgi:hypothetical protein
MWDKFGGYLLLVLGHATRAERVQVRPSPEALPSAISFAVIDA